MNKVLVFIYNDMADFEITLVAHLLATEAGKEIITIAYEDKIIKSKSGIEYKPLKLVKDVLGEDIEGLIIPGGWNGENRSELIELIQSIHTNGKLLGAICAGPRFLAKAGILNKVKYTTSIAEWTELHEKMFNESDPFPRENYISERVVRDDNVITALGTAFVDFSAEICDWFGLFKDEDDKNDFLRSLRGV